MLFYPIHKKISMLFFLVCSLATPPCHIYCIEALSHLSCLFSQDRGLDDKSKIPYFPYRDDGEAVLESIEAMVDSYVNL